jgi:hypothetical protein
MTRIEPECFVECWRNKRINGTLEQSLPTSIKELFFDLKETEYWNNLTIALFLIKPQPTTLAERLEARKVNKNLK